MFACLVGRTAGAELLAVARAFSPRVEWRDRVAVILDVSGLHRIVGEPPVIGRELAREARERGIDAAVAIAATRTAAMLLARGQDGLSVVAAGVERVAVGALPIAVLEALAATTTPSDRCALCVLCGEFPGARHGLCGARGPCAQLPILRGWGLRTLGELAALAPGDLCARLGVAGLALHGVACGRDARPLVPHVDAARFEASLDLEWPIETLEPLSFVLARLLDPLSTALERADRGAAAIALTLTLVTRETHEIRLELPAPMRDARTLRTLLVLALEARPAPAGIDRVAIAIDPTPGRIVQHSLLQRARPSPECLSTLVARLEALMGAGRVGSPSLVDSHEPGAFELRSFVTPHGVGPALRPGVRGSPERSDDSYTPDLKVGPTSLLRRFRLPVPARVVLEHGRPVRVTTMRRGLAGGRVEQCAGPWRTSGGWWTPSIRGWDRDDWDVATRDGLFRIYRDRAADRWFIEGIVD